MENEKKWAVHTSQKTLFINKFSQFDDSTVWNSLDSSLHRIWCLLLVYKLSFYYFTGW